jgi:hypothetical protein
MPSTPRYQVFVSSTYTDLIEERRAVMSALLQFDALPAGMELFPAASDEAWTLIQQVIDQSDYYLLMIGGRYGSIDLDGVGFTEKEYDYAVGQDKPVMAFLHDHPDDLPFNANEVDPAAREKLEAFREKVKRSKHVKFWDSPQTLTLHVIQSFTYFVKTYPAVGWVRGNETDSPKTLARLAQAQETIGALEEQLQTQATQPPAGAAGLASDDEKLEVDCTFGIDIRNVPTGAKISSSQSLDGEIAISWNEVLFYLGPLLLDEASQGDLNRRFTEAIRDLGSDQAQQESRDWLLSATKDIDWAASIPSGKKEPRIHVTINPDQSGFETALLQLQALGLLTHGAKKRGVNDHRVYWTLTPWGRTRLMQLRSVKSGSSRPTDRTNIADDV